MGPAAEGGLRGTAGKTAALRARKVHRKQEAIMKALLMKRTSIIALACTLAAAAAVGIGVAQASAADMEASDNVTVEERIEGTAKGGGVYLEVDDPTEEPEGGVSEVAADKADSLAEVGITDDGIEKPFAEGDVTVDGEDEAKAEKEARKSAKAGAPASNAIENEYIEVEERAAEDLDETDAEGSMDVSAYIDEDEAAENIVELPAE